MKINFALVFSFLMSVSSAITPLAHADSRWRAPDWKSEFITGIDTRFPLPKKAPATFEDEVIEIPYTNPLPPQGRVLMLPALTQNAALYDIAPERGISFGRYVQDQLHLQVYLLNPRGMGQSTKSTHISLDELAIDDLPAAIQWMKEKFPGEKIYLFGHSEGGILLQASLGGLTRCTEVGRDCFRPEVAAQRQAGISGVLISAGSVTLRTTERCTHLNIMYSLMVSLKFPLRKFDYFELGAAGNSFLARLLSESGLWRNIFFRKNVDPKTANELFERTVESAWGPLLIQIASGIHQNGIHALTKTGELGELFTTGLPDIKIPTVQVAYNDCFAEPIPTYKTDFVHIGAAQKKFFSHMNFSHEDVFLNSKLHEAWDEPFQFILSAQNNVTDDKSSSNLRH